MLNLDELLRKQAEKVFDYRPSIFNFALEVDREKAKGLFDVGDVKYSSDDYEEQQRELYGVNNPPKVYQPDFEKEFKQYFEKLCHEQPIWQHGRWVFYPWRSALVHILSEEEFWQIRTARNRNLISKTEQQKFYRAVVGIGGLSVGNSVAMALVLQGGAKHIKLADHDHLALSNTNRILTSITNLGLRKVEMAARQIYELNPYAEVELYPDGLTADNIKRFFSEPKLDIVIDELDNLAVKYLIRVEAKKCHLPVVMAADNGDNAVVDIERYDLEPQPEFFHGRMGEVSYEMLKNLDKFGIGKMITKHIGPENVTTKMQESLLEMGKTIVSWPQLGGAALINGSAVAYCVRRILCGQSLEPNRSLISLDEKLLPDYHSPESIKKREAVALGFRKNFEL